MSAEDGFWRSHVSLKRRPHSFGSGAVVMSENGLIVKAHPVDPRALARELADEGIESGELLGDIEEHPDLYYSDHVHLSQEQGVLPLSDTAWRRACRSV